MSGRLLQFSIVIIAADHNPTILNPDFLRMQGIVPEDWGWELASPPIVTPPFASVQYESGVSLSVESNKLQIADTKTTEPTESKITEIAKQYVKVVPHVRYTAVGINYRIAIEVEDADTYLKSQFLKKGPWNSDDNPMNSVGLNFVYPAESGRIVLSIDSGTVSDTSGSTEQKQSVIIANANFHRDLDLSKMPTSGQVSDCLNKNSSDWQRYNEILARMLPIEQRQSA